VLDEQSRDLVLPPQLRKCQLRRRRPQRRCRLTLQHQPNPRVKLPRRRCNNNAVNGGQSATNKSSNCKANGGSRKDHTSSPGREVVGCISCQGFGPLCSGGSSGLAYAWLNRRLSARGPAAWPLASAWAMSPGTRLGSRTGLENAGRWFYRAASPPSRRHSQSRRMSCRAIWCSLDANCKL